MTGKYGKHTAKGEIRFGVLPQTISLQIREPGSAITHFAGFILVLIGSGPLITRASLYGSSLTVISLLTFILSAALLYAASTAYHTIVADKKTTRIFKKIDHMMIPILIAGSYTPFCLITLRENGGHIVFAAIWGMALLSIILKAFWVTCPKWISSAVYLAMGWVCIFVIVPLAQHLPLAAFILLALGGIFYTVGAVIYAMKMKRFNEIHPYFGSHEIFHVFIMLGTLCHYLIMYGYMVYCS